MPCFLKGVTEETDVQIQFGFMFFVVDNFLAQFSAWDTATHPNDVLWGLSSHKARKDNSLLIRALWRDNLWFHQAEALRRSQPWSLSGAKGCCWLPVLLADSPAAHARAFRVIDSKQTDGSTTQWWPLRMQSMAQTLGAIGRRKLNRQKNFSVSELGWKTLLLLIDWKLEDKIHFRPSACWPRKPSCFQQPLLAILRLLNTHNAPKKPWGQLCNSFPELCGEANNARG